MTPDLGAGMAVLVDLVEVGGPVVAILLALSIVAVAIGLWKIAVFAVSRVGRHRGVLSALDAYDTGDTPRALEACGSTGNHLAPLLQEVILHRPTLESSEAFKERITNDAVRYLARLQSGFRFLDSIAQLSPLLGLFGTVLGMIDAFQALQGAGVSVDPSILAGGIWVALLTTAVGLGVAMPTSVLLTWLESRVEAERSLAESIIARGFYPTAPTSAALAPGAV